MFHYLTKRFISAFRIHARMLITIGLLFCGAVNANKQLLHMTESSVNEKSCQQAKALCMALKQSDESQHQSMKEQIKVALAEGDFEVAEGVVETLLSTADNDAESFYWAGRLKVQQAQQANLFSRVYYYRQAMKYFVRVLQENPLHQEAMIELIQFHQQAPVMAGADKQSIPEVIKQLRTVNSRAAFILEAPRWLSRNQMETALSFYKQAVKTPSAKHLSQFRFNAAMIFSGYGHHQIALDEMLLIDEPQNALKEESLAMRHYQIAKLTAETNTQLNLGLKHIKTYAELPNQIRTIADDWITFRRVQLQFLKHPNQELENHLLSIKAKTKLKSLSEKIESFLDNQ